MSTASPGPYKRPGAGAAGLRPVWCPGCGNFAVLRALQQALADLGVPPAEVMAFSGIGCSGRLSHYLNAYSLHGTHGRALPTATGAKAVRPELTVLVVSGDGDALGIGGGHIAHAARRNVDLTYLILDNHTYGLTKGQASPTTPFGSPTRTSPYGAYEDPLDAIPMFITYDVSFLARTSSIHVRQMTSLIEAAISHRGFSIVYVLSPCVTYPLLTPEELRRRLVPLPEEHDPGDRFAALKAAYSREPVYTGLLYRERRPTLDERLLAQFARLAERVPAVRQAGLPAGEERLTLAELLERFA